MAREGRQPSVWGIPVSQANRYRSLERSHSSKLSGQTRFCHPRRQMMKTLILQEKKRLRCTGLRNQGRRRSWLSGDLMEQVIAQWECARVNGTLVVYWSGYRTPFAWFLRSRSITRGRGGISWVDMVLPLLTPCAALSTRIGSEMFARQCSAWFKQGSWRRSDRHGMVEQTNSSDSSS